MSNEHAQCSQNDYHKFDNVCSLNSKKQKHFVWFNAMCAHQLFKNSAYFIVTGRVFAPSSRYQKICALQFTTT